MYKYRGKVSVPPLEMVDDIITVAKCGNMSVKLNPTVNASIEEKKLALSGKFFSNIHIGNKASKETCPELKIHDEIMKSCEVDKYLGDFVTKNCNSKDTIKSRNIRANAIISEMRAILKDIPLGNWRTQIGIVLRKAWFLNGCFFNSEVWTGLSESDFNYLNIIDHQIL